MKKLTSQDTILVSAAADEGRKEDTRDLDRCVNAMRDAASLGASGGALIGAGVGSAVPGIGTGVGAALGAGVGANMASTNPACCGSRDTGNGGTNNGSSRVICTYFYSKKMLSRTVWRADMDFTRKYLSDTTVRGYHFWAIPYVKLMRRSLLAEKLMLPIAKCRAEELAYQMGVMSKPNVKGKLVRLVLEPICFLIGLFCVQRNWQALWVSKH